VRKKPRRDAYPNEFETNDQFCPGCDLELKTMPIERTNLYLDVFQADLDSESDQKPDPGLLSLHDWSLERHFSAEVTERVAVLRTEIEALKKAQPQYPLLHGSTDSETVRTMLETGPWLTPLTSPTQDQSGTNILGRGAQLRPDRIGNGNISNPTPDQWFDINAFVPTPAGAGRIGNAGVGILEGPGTIAVAGGLSKNFFLLERLRLRFQASFTNLLNHPNFLPPSTDVSSPNTFGKTSSVQTAENGGNRTGQLALRLEF
jgi:hypothetical protein